MAQVSKVIYVDDLTGEPIPDGEAVTMRISVDGVDYAADLSAESHAKITETLEPFLTSFRRIGGRKTRRVAAPSGLDNATIRRWAAENGHTVSDRGRIPREIVEAFQKAH